MLHQATQYYTDNINALSAKIIIDMKNNLLFSQTTALCKTLGKRLAMVLTVLFTLGVGSMLGETITFTNSTLPTGWSGTGSFDPSNNHYHSNAPGYALGSGKYLQTAEYTNITSLTFWGSTSNGGNGQSLKIQYQEKGSNTWNDLSSIVLNKSAQVQKTVTVTSLAGKTVSLKFSTTWNTAYLDDIEIVTASAHTVTWTINPAAGGTLSETSGNTTTVTPNDAYTYGNPAYTVTSGKATVSQNNNTFTASPTANCTIQINMVEKPKYTVTLKDNNSTLAQSTAGGSVTLPTREGCDGYTFAGWTSSWTSAQTDWTTTKPTIINAGSYTPTANVDLYPVYTKTEGGGSTTTQIVDQLTHSINGKESTNTTYTSFSNKTFTSDAVYAGSTANGNNNEAKGVIQIRSSSSNTGIITTTSGGLAKKVVVEWHSYTPSGRTLDIYGKNSA